MNDDNLIRAALLALGFLIAGGTLRSLIKNRHRQKMAQLQSETVGKVLDRLGSGPEVLEWLKTGDMKKFFDIETPTANPGMRVLNAIQWGTIASLAGAMLFTVPDLSPDGHVIRWLLLAVGGGFLISAAASYVLLKRWGLIERDERHGEDR
ncbi:MAG: hypothetical protein SFV18_01660 [Bryobacteraceae bacterium]|jgi:hypothetical protein|nr:hypothetical protein [Bryobacteraceae bacterium]